MFNSSNKTKKIDPTVCTCQCHKEGVFMMHMVACCHICKDCGEEISTGKSEKHKEFCTKKLKKED